MGEPGIKPIFTKGPSLGLRTLLLSLLALVLICLYSYTNILDKAADKAVDIIFPTYWLVDTPSRVRKWGENKLLSKEALLVENEHLKTELLIHRRKLQKMASVVAENTRLRQLLNSADVIDDRVLVAELVGVFPDPAVHKVIINRGSHHGVFQGQPVVDANGLVGQVVRVGHGSSVILLISDPSHAIPVQINRNGVRLVVEGHGSVHSMKLRHVSSTIDVQEGDLLVSSGLGLRFPYGYPVARVVSVRRDPGKAFVDVIAKPMADLNKNRHVLLVFERVLAEEILPPLPPEPPKEKLDEEQIENPQIPVDDAVQAEQSEFEAQGAESDR